ncbi:MAG TPA: glycosyltransferase, partial [Saprospiraceae bacterium]|nr:glycosyltransferase [Saprospiraceae bacterium]
MLAVLNWGLGHAARCIPIVKELQLQGAEIILASDGNAMSLLEIEFPELTCLRLPAYNIKYDSTNMMFTIAKQIPKIISAIQKENLAVQKIVAQYKIDIIISDNRYGCYHQKTKNIFITHQINLLIPFTPFEKIARWINKKRINQFDECWIPDFEGEDNIAGLLSHQHSLENTKYIGNLSRMQKLEVEKKYDVIVVLSGPEPQRSFLEKIIIDQAKKIPQKFLIIQGKVRKDNPKKIHSNIELIPFLSSKFLNKAICESSVMISR